MHTTFLLSAAVALVLSAGGAAAAARPVPTVKIHAPHIKLFPGKMGAKTLYDQTSSVGSQGVSSQNFESTYSAYNDQGADDFTVPKKTTWTVTEVDVQGQYYNGYGPAASETVIFYNDDNGLPGKPVKKGSFSSLKGQDDIGSFTISLGKKGLKLKPGHYWVSVAANCSFASGCGQWAWLTNTKVFGAQAAWQNPGGGFGVCPTWGSLMTCFGLPDDFAFAVKGTAKK